MPRDEFQEWVQAGIGLAEKKPELRRVMADAFFNMGIDASAIGCEDMLGEAYDTIAAMMGPLAPAGGCLCCGNPSSRDMCEMCRQDYGGDPDIWPDWIKRRATDRATRCTEGIGSR